LRGPRDNRQIHSAESRDIFGIAGDDFARTTSDSDSVDHRVDRDMLSGGLPDSHSCVMRLRCTPA
jgi:hypothetical protein